MTSVFILSALFVEWKTQNALSENVCDYEHLDTLRHKEIQQKVN